MRGLLGVSCVDHINRSTTEKTESKKLQQMVYMCVSCVLLYIARENGDRWREARLKRSPRLMRCELSFHVAATAPSALRTHVDIDHFDVSALCVFWRG